MKSIIIAVLLSASFAHAGNYDIFLATDNRFYAYQVIEVDGGTANLEYLVEDGVTTTVKITPVLTFANGWVPMKELSTTCVLESVKVSIFNSNYTRKCVKEIVELENGELRFRIPK